MPNNDTQPKTPKSRRGMIALLTAAIVALGGAWSLQSFADSKTVQHIKVHAAGGSGWFAGKRHFAGWRRGRHEGFLDLSDTEVKAKLTRAMKHVAIEIDATQEQQDKIVALVSGTIKELRPVRDSMRSAAHEMREMLLSDTPDRSAMERLRAERLAEADRISKTLMNTLADVAAVLTPAQRKLLDERIKEHRGRHRG